MLNLRMRTGHCKLADVAREPFIQLQYFFLYKVSSIKYQGQINESAVKCLHFIRSYKDLFYICLSRKCQNINYRKELIQKNEICYLWTEGQISCLFTAIILIKSEADYNSMQIFLISSSLLCVCALLQNKQTNKNNN